VLRPHEVFESPLPVDLAASVPIDTPDAWKHAIDDPQVQILPLVDDISRQYRDGWCTYTYEHVQAPELEIICGGVNAKTPKASAIWRQGHLLHFGFEQSPAEMNDNGRALLANSICYIARFTEDRPIVRTPSGHYASNVRMQDREALDRLVKQLSRDLDKYLDYYLGDSAREAVRGMTRDEFAAWYRENRGFLHADPRGKLVVDAAAREFGVAPNSGDFIPAAIAAWREDGKRTEPAKELLDRYVADGLGETKTTSPADWERWWRAHRDYLFFTDTGGFRWHIDGLAKRRAVPTASLRGIQRASRPPVRPSASLQRGATDEQ